MADCVGTVAGLMTGLVLAASEPITVATSAPFPAYIDIDASGQIIGFERDLMDEVCLRAVLTCTWTLANFDELLPGVMSGQYDVALGGMAVTAERRDLVDFTAAYYFTDDDEWYIGRPGAPEPSKARVAVQSGTIHHAHVRAMGYNTQAFATEGEVLDALVAGRVDLALGPFETRDDLAPLFAENGFDHLYSEMIPDDGVAMAVCKGNTDLLQKLDVVLEAMRADGTIAALEDRWFQ